MTPEEKNSKGPQNQNDDVDIAKSPAPKDLVQKSIEECLSDSDHETNELFELYDSMSQSLMDFDDLVKNQEKELKEIKEKRFHIRKPISTYRLEEKIDIFHSQIDIYKESFIKMETDVKSIMDSLFSRKIPTTEKRTISERKRYFAMIYEDAIKELDNRQKFLGKIEQAKK